MKIRMDNKLWPLVLLLPGILASSSSDNLLHNPGFEHELNHWKCNPGKCEVQLSQDSYDGLHSLHVHSRSV